MTITMTTKPNPYATMTKDHLLAVKAQFLDDIAKNPPGNVIVMINAELAQVNEAIKNINIIEANEKRAAADRRKAEGQRILAENTARALAKKHQPGDLLTRDMAPASTPSTNPGPQKNKGRRFESLGEFILMRADQLRAAIRKIRADRHAFTDEFITHLEAYIVAQRDLVQREKKARELEKKKAAVVVPVPATTEVADWKETWKSD